MTRCGKLFLAPLLLCLCAGAAHAGWEYDGYYIGEGAYFDDGSRFTVSVRGGASMSAATIKNEVGTLTSEYYYDPATGQVMSAGYCGENCDQYTYAGIADLAALPPRTDFSAFSFAAGASLGWTIPNRPQWRLELGWDHISESEYNSSPLYEGDLELVGGDVSGVVLHLTSGSVQSSVSTDVISVMAFYDFYDGLYKPLNTAIPYIGFGLGYADSQTVLNLADLYGDLSESIDMGNFGDMDDYGVVQFYRSETNSANIAGILAVGLSYGLTEYMFLDFGARLMYVPKIKWRLSNVDGSRNRDWFSAENMFYANIMLGVRFEF